MNLELRELIRRIDQFNSWNHAEKIKFFGWFLQTYRSKTAFKAAEIKACYDDVSAEPPSSVAPFLAAMEQKRPKEMVRAGGSYRLEHRVHQMFDQQFGQRLSAVQVATLLSSLPSRVPSLDERTYLDEALVCFKNGAFRAAVLMTWNLVYHHLCHRILQDPVSTAAFNSAWQHHFPGDHKKSVRSIGKYEDFGEELREKRVVEICYFAGLITKEMNKTLLQKLDRRNTVAHPSKVTITTLQAEEYIHDLVENVFLKIT